MYGVMTISTICTDSHYKTCNGVVVHTIVLCNCVVHVVYGVLCVVCIVVRTTVHVWCNDYQYDMY